mgnify:CR=1 FL=1
MRPGQRCDPAFHSLCVVVIFVVLLWRNGHTGPSFTSVPRDGSVPGQQPIGVYKNSLLMAVLTALAGLITTYGAALPQPGASWKKVEKYHREHCLVTNTIPGMVIGIAFLLIFTGTPLQNTLALIILCNVVHFFSTPYLMMKKFPGEAQQLLGDNSPSYGRFLGKDHFRIVTPNMRSTDPGMYSATYFVNRHGDS